MSDTDSSDILLSTTLTAGKETDDESRSKKMSEKIKEQREKEAGDSGSTGEKNAAKKTEKGGSDRLFHKFEPVFDNRCRILILGTFPSVKSREQNFYYGHPRNRFWRIIAELTHSPLPVTKAEKTELLLKNHIALWDVIESCEITGSSDSSIRNVVPARLERILSEAPVEKIYANGGTAKRLFDRYQKKQTGREIVGLPSTSPANASWSYERLLEAWSCIIRE